MWYLWPATDLLLVIPLYKVTYRSSNFISPISTKFFDSSLFQIFDLHDNELVSLPNEIDEMKHLQVLNLENNKLKNLPTSIGSLISLQTLNLKGMLSQEPVLYVTSFTGNIFGNKSHLIYYLQRKGHTQPLLKSLDKTVICSSKKLYEKSSWILVWSTVNVNGLSLPKSILEMSPW